MRKKIKLEGYKEHKGRARFWKETVKEEIWRSKECEEKESKGWEGEENYKYYEGKGDVSLEVFEPR